MRRNQELILKILEDCEKEGGPYAIFTGFHFEGHDQAEVDYHVELCKNAGYFSLNTTGKINMLSMYGHDVLEAIRAESES